MPATETEVSFPGLALCTPLGAVAPMSQGKSTIPPTSQASKNESPIFRGGVGVLPFPEGLQGLSDYEMRKLPYNLALSGSDGNILLD